MKLLLLFASILLLTGCLFFATPKIKVNEIRASDISKIIPTSHPKYAGGSQICTQVACHWILTN